MVYVDLKRFRLEHRPILQSELARILGVSQSTLSRLESAYKDLTDIQYRSLVERFGEEDVKKYVETNPTLYLRKRRKTKGSNSETVETLTRVINTYLTTMESLKNEIETLKEENDELKQRIKELKTTKEQ